MDDAPDPEKNRLSRRVTRYARVGANVGGVAAKMAGARLFGRDLGDQRNAADLMVALGGLKGPLMKLAQLLSTVPGPAAARICRRTAEAPGFGAADGAGLRQAADEGGARARLEAAASPPSTRRRPPPPRSARFTAPPVSTAAISPASSSIPTCSRRSKPTSASSAWCSRCSAASIPRSILSEIAKELSERLARGTRLSPRGEQRGALWRGAGRRADDPGAGHDRRTLSTRRLLTMGWLDGSPLLSFLDHASRTGTASPRRCSGRGGIPSPPTGSSTATRISAITASSRRPAGRPGSTFSTMAASGSSRRASSAAWSSSITASSTTTATASSRPIGAGDSPTLNNEQIDILNIWAALHLCAADRRPGADHRRRDRSACLWPSRGVEGQAGAEGRAADQRAARIRADGPGRDRPRLGDAPPQGGTEFPSPFRRGGRRFRRGEARQPAGRGDEGRRA